MLSFLPRPFVVLLIVGVVAALFPIFRFCGGWSYLNEREPVTFAYVARYGNPPSGTVIGDPVAGSAALYNIAIGEEWSDFAAEAGLEPRGLLSVRGKHIAIIEPANIEGPTLALRGEPQSPASVEDWRFREIAVLGQQEVVLDVSAAEDVSITLPIRAGQVFRTGRVRGGGRSLGLQEDAAFASVDPQASGRPLELKLERAEGTAAGTVVTLNRIRFAGPQGIHEPFEQTALSAALEADGAELALELGFSAEGEPPTKFEIAVAEPGVQSSMFLLAPMTDFVSERSVGLLVWGTDRLQIEDPDELLVLEIKQGWFRIDSDEGRIELRGESSAIELNGEDLVKTRWEEIPAPILGAVAGGIVTAATLLVGLLWRSLSEWRPRPSSG